MSPSRVILAAVLLYAGLGAAQTFNLTASRSNSSLDGQTVNAAGGSFYLGLDAPATYCPTQVNPYCPNVTGTIFSGNSLWVEVPGGQQLYVDVDGAFSFTQAHSTYIPPNAYTSGFTNTTTTSAMSGTRSILNFITPGTSKGGILACPNVPSWENGTSTYQIYAQTPAFNQTNCTALAGLLIQYQPDDAYGAWQYT